MFTFPSLFKRPSRLQVLVVLIVATGYASSQTVPVTPPQLPPPVIYLPPVPPTYPAPVPLPPSIPAAPMPPVSAAPPPPGSGPFWRSTAIPAACVIADEIHSTTACDVLDAVELDAKLAGAESSREVRRIIAEEFAKKVVFMAFPEEMHLDRKVALVQEFYAAERRQFNALLSSIEISLLNDQKAGQLRTEFAISDSQSIADLRQQAHDENKQTVDDASQYLEQHPRSSGIQFECRLACHQVVAAARGVNVFD